jgi:tetratricopeptide (TPR) repeat protein
MNRNADMVEEAVNNQSGAEAEANGDIEEAVQLYERNIKSGIANSFPFDRLMVIYRKQKRYKDELRVINRGIEVFNNLLEKQQQHMLANTKNKKQLQRLSEAFGKKTGLTGKKGNVYVPAPVSKWLKRKEVVNRKLKKS